MTKYKENPLNIKTQAIGLQQNKLYLWTHELRKGKVFLSAELKSILELFFFFPEQSQIASGLGRDKK